MAVTSSAPIDIGDLVTEFGGSTPHSLTEYYRGGSLVPNTTTNAGVPTTGNPISLTDFYGASATSGTDDYTLTIGTSIIVFSSAFGFSSTTSDFGGIDPNTIEFGGFNVTITDIYYSLSNIFFVARSGDSSGPGDSGWTSMTIGSTTFRRDTGATFSNGSYHATWSWSSSNIIGDTVGDEQTVSWIE